MKYLKSDTEYHYFISTYLGNDFYWRKDRKTNEFLVDCDDAAKSLGYDSMHDMLLKEPKAMDKFLDGINDGSLK